jgi:hypothetical protein
MQATYIHIPGSWVQATSRTSTALADACRPCCVHLHPWLMDAGRALPQHPSKRRQRCACLSACSCVLQRDALGNASAVHARVPAAVCLQRDAVGDVSAVHARVRCSTQLQAVNDVKHSTGWRCLQSQAHSASGKKHGLELPDLHPEGSAGFCGDDQDIVTTVDSGQLHTVHLLSRRNDAGMNNLGMQKRAMCTKLFARACALANRMLFIPALYHRNSRYTVYSFPKSTVATMPCRSRRTFGAKIRRFKTVSAMTSRTHLTTNSPERNSAQGAPCGPRRVWEWSPCHPRPASRC